MVTQLDVVALLDSLAPLYPGGVPRFEQKSLSAVEKPARSGVAVYGDSAAPLVVLGLGDPTATNPLLEGPAGELLTAALTEGLKLDLGAVTFVAVVAGADPAAVGAALNPLGCRCGLALGEDVARYLGEASPEDGWLTRGAVRWRVTPTPRAVVADSRLKRALWNDLQAVGSELAGGASNRNGGAV